MYITRTLQRTSGISTSDLGWKGYVWKKLHDPNRFKTKYARRQGWTYEEGVNEDPHRRIWQQGQDPCNKFPFNIGFDGMYGPIRHRDFRSAYRDPEPNRISHWYENPRDTLHTNSNSARNSRMYKRVYPKCGPSLPKDIFPFRLNDTVEIVEGRSAGERGPICYINEQHNYIVVAGCNFDYSERATKNGMEPLETPLLPKHIRLVDEDTDMLVESLEFYTDSDGYISRRCADTKKDQPFDGDRYNHDAVMVNAGSSVNCLESDYPLGPLDTDTDSNLFTANKTKFSHLDKYVSDSYIDRDLKQEMCAVMYKTRDVQDAAPGTNKKAVYDGRLTKPKKTWWY